MRRSQQRYSKFAVVIERPDNDTAPKGIVRSDDCRPHAYRGWIFCGGSRRIDDRRGLWLVIEGVGAIELFVSHFGLRLAADPSGAAGLTPTEIAYAGQNANDPDIMYRGKPGLCGLRMALAQLGQAPFEPGTSKIVQPTEVATAARYLRYAMPLLNWYRYKS